MKKAILVAIIGAMTLGVNAGDWGKAPVPAKAPIEECVDIGGSISAGYMTDYIFYGVRFARDSVWTDVNYTFDNLIVPINVGAWYLNGINPAGVDELDLYIAAELGTYYGFDVSLGYTHFFFPEGGFPSYGEIGLDIARSFSIVDFAWETNYAFNERGAGVVGGSTGGGWYHQASLSKEFGLTDKVSLVITGGVGWSNGYFNGGATFFNPGVVAGQGLARANGINHYFVTAELPIELNCRATLTPYISYNGTPSGSVANNLGGPANGMLPNASSDVLSGDRKSVV